VQKIKRGILIMKRKGLRKIMGMRKLSALEYQSGA